MIFIRTIGAPFILPLVSVVIVWIFANLIKNRSRIPTYVDSEEEKRYDSSQRQLKGFMTELDFLYQLSYAYFAHALWGITATIEKLAASTTISGAFFTPVDFLIYYIFAVIWSFIIIVHSNYRDRASLNPYYNRHLLITALCFCGLRTAMWCHLTI